MPNEFPSSIKFNMGQEAEQTPAPLAVPDLPELVSKEGLDALTRPDVRELMHANDIHVLVCDVETHTAELVRAKLAEAGLSSQVVVVGAGPSGLGLFSREARQVPDVVELLSDDRLSLPYLRDFHPWVVDRPKNEPWYRQFAKDRRTGKRY